MPGGAALTGPTDYGFDSQQTFTRIFTRTFNQPPGAYRKENHSQTTH
ncbi:hypothetical protein [Enterobacter mori]